MYFPYLRGKQEETLALREATFCSSRTVPIYEPTNLNATNRNRLRQAIEEGRRIALVTNSAKGEPPPTVNEVCNFIEEIPSESVFPAIEIRPDTLPIQIQFFAQRFHNRICVAVHRNHTHSSRQLSELLYPLSDSVVHVLIDGGISRAVLRDLPARGFVLLRDGFNHESRNADYPAQSHFDDLLFNFDELEFSGFGDFTIVGDRYSSTGGPAHAVALHLTEIAPTGIVANHFVSQPPHVSGDVAGKFFSALGLLVRATEGRPDFDTDGVNAYRNSWSSVHYAGLGQPKRWSMLHHFEIIEKSLAIRGAPTCL